VQRLFALVLWAATMALGMADIYFCREIFFAIYARFSTEGRPALVMGNIIVVLGAIVFVGFVVLTSEYHLKHVGEHSSWDLFTRTLVVELAIPFMAYFMV
jgi:hypothetical protein